MPLKPKYSYVYLVIFLLIYRYANTLTCDKVASLPPNFDTLLPNHHKLYRAHLTNYFFLDEANEGEELKFHLKILKKSVIKLQVTPYHTSIKIDIDTPKLKDSLETTSGVPIDFTLLDPKNMFEGELVMKFYDLIPLQDTMAQEIKDSVSKDTVCNVPYMVFEILYEHYEHFQARVIDISKIVHNLPDFTHDFWNVFQDLSKADVKNKGNDLLVQKIKRDISAYQLNVKNNIEYYTKYGLNVFAEFDLNVNEEHTVTKESMLVKKMFIKMQIYSEFLIGGGLYIMIINKKELDSLEEFNCVYEGKCLLSRRSSKNGMILESILTPGEYKLLLVNINMDPIEYKKFLNLTSLPISAGIKIKNIQSTENRFDCKGRKLPATFNHLLNLDRNYFEYKGKIIFNMHDLMDEVYFTIPYDDDYIMRLNTYYSEGNSIRIRLYEVDSERLFNELTKNYTINLDNQNILEEIRKQSTLKVLTTESSNVGGQSSIYAPLYKNKIYYLQFDYSESFFAQYERKSCELFYMKLFIASMTHIKNMNSYALYAEDKCVFDHSLIDSFLAKFSQEHGQKSNYVHSEYEIVSKNIMHYNNIYGGKDLNVIYTKDFKVNADINFYIEIMCDFVTSSVIPVIIPKMQSKAKSKRKTSIKEEDIIESLMKERRTILLHKSTMNMKLTKGEYTLILIHGLTQFTPNKKGLSPLYNEVYLPKCAMFQMKINTILLNSKKMQTWECLYKKHHHIPDRVTIDDRQEKFYYFNHHILIPIERDIIKITTTKEKLFLRLRAQFQRNEDVDIMNISLKKNKKTLTRARKEIFEEGASTLILYMNYVLLPNSDYELHFANVFKDFGKFYDKCRVFTMDLLVTNINANKDQNINCDKNIPDISHVVYERLIDVDNTFSKYKSATIYQMAQNAKKSNSNEVKTKNDLEVNPNQSMFIYRFRKNEQMEYSFNFEIATSAARATLIVETPYALPLEISAKIYFLTNDTKKITHKELIGTLSIEDESLLSLRGILLTGGKYEVVLGVNQKMYRETIKDALSDFCVEYTASLIIENKTFDARRKSALQKSENCPYNEFPENLNVPGWIYTDTSFSMNLMQRFKIKNEKMVKKFNVYKKSLFKFHIPEEDHANFHKSITLSIEKGDLQTELVHKINKDDNYIALFLDEGKYSLEFEFELNERKGFFLYKDQDDFEHLCYYFDVYIALQPTENFIDLFNNPSCDVNTNALDTLRPDSSMNYKQIVSKSKAESDNVDVVRTIKVEPNTISKSKIQFEYISNTYFDPLYSFVVYRIDDADTRIEINREYYQSGNFIWIIFNVEKSTRYEIDFVSGSYENISVCSTGYFSYSYVNQLVMDESIFKGKCEVDARLPTNFFDNSGNALTPYGKGQTMSNGEMYFYGKFLLPKSGNSLRSEFIIKEESIIFIQVKPLYKKTNNIYIELFKGRSKISTYVHNNFNGLVIASLSNKSFFSVGNEENNYYLELTFERHLRNCDAFELLFSIIPSKAYREVYMNCDNVEEDSDSEQIPREISITRTKLFQFSSHIKRGFSQNADNNLEKIIAIDIETPAAIDIVLKYVHSDNMMDVSLTSEKSKTFYKLGSESIEGGHVNGIWVHKTISTNLKKGKYYIKLLFHSMFNAYLNKIFSSDKDIENSICFGFNLDITATVLDFSDNKAKDDDELNDDREIKKITKNDYSKNTIINAKPNGATKLRPGNKLEITISFAYDTITNANQLNSFNQLIYLTDKDDSQNKIFASYIGEYHTDSIVYVFELNSRIFKPKKCFKLNFNSQFASTIEDKIISQTDMIYCMMKCECNPKSNFSCSLKGKCRCKSPYKGDKCDLCEKGYILSNANECIDEKLTSIKCNDKTTCNNNGHCIIPNSNFDPFDKNVKNPCECNRGFETMNGYPTSSFCNKCSNSKRFYPFCLERTTSDNLKEKVKFSFMTHCSDFSRAPTLPSKLYSVSLEKPDDAMSGVKVQFDDIQRSDGSLAYSSVLKVKEEIEYTSILIKEDSIVRVMFISKEMNRAKVYLLKNKNDNNDYIAKTEGKEKSESFIARLKRREQPYVIKIMHFSLRASCNRYQIKIAIQPVTLVSNSLTCVVVKDKLDSYLPKSEINIEGNDNFTEINSQWYHVTDELILTRENFVNKKYYKQNEEVNEKEKYGKKGVLSNANIDEVFEYNIKLNVNAPITFSAVARYKFLTNEVMLKLRRANGTLLSRGSWINSESFDESEDFFSGLEAVLDPGEYYLTISEFIAVNHLTQMFYISENEHEYKTRCFDFKLNLQSNLIMKPNSGISTEEFEKKFNRIIRVEPSSSPNSQVTKPLTIHVTFSNPISQKPKSDVANEMKPRTFVSFFYLENVDVKTEIIYPNQVVLGKYNGKTFEIIFKENSLRENACYVLKYDLSNLESSYDKKQTIMSDAPIEHRYCTKTCECNPNTDFTCDFNKQCICKLPYTGDKCERCINGYYFTKESRCISQYNCDNTICNGKGKCYAKDSVNQTPSCLCSAGFTGEDCGKCSNATLIFPDCIVDIPRSGEVIGESLFNNKISRSENDCEFQFVPFDLDTLAYLHLDGNMHISGKYSLKAINGKNFITTFTLKETSHFKIYLEHATLTQVITMFLLDREKNLLVRSSTKVGPAGAGTASIIDFVGDIGVYYIVFYIKDLGTVENEVSITYEDALKDEDNSNTECINVFLEMQSMTVERESNVINGMKEGNIKCMKGTEDEPQLIPKSMTVYDFQSSFYIELARGITNTFTHIRNAFANTDEKINYFHYEYIYIPDYVDQQLAIELDVNSKFLNAEIGIVLEIVELPTRLKSKTHKLNSERINEYFGKKINEPLCEIHCFTGVKKYNSVVLSRILPSDTFFRIWFYDISPSPTVLNGIAYLPNKCVTYQTTLMIFSIQSSSDTVNKQIASSLCQSNELPDSLNVKEYLGDAKYFKRFGFHILDSFRIDRAGMNNSMHVTHFSIDAYHLFRLVVFPGRVDTDLELYFIDEEDKNTEILISKSNSKNFEDVIAIEIPKGKYKIVFKFYPPPSGYHKCESMRMEFAMQNMKYITDNVNRMIMRYNNKEPSTHPKISIMRHLTHPNEIFNKDLQTITYTFPLQREFVINEDDKNKYIPSVSIAEITFVVEEKDNKKLQLNGMAISNFLFVDCGLYLTYTPNGNKESKVIIALHRKNMNSLISKKLQSGTYVISLRYYRRLHYKKPKKLNKYEEDMKLSDATFAEVHFDIQMINISDDVVTILTSEGYLKLPPQGSKSISHNHLCRKFGLPVPRTLSQLRYLLFEPETHILDTFLLPPLGKGEDVIKFKLQKFPSAMIRVYVESGDTEISITLYKKAFANKLEEMAKSANNIHFATIMELIDDQTEYQIVLNYGGFANGENTFKNCATFKMEIAIEKNHNYACPANNKYALLSEIKAVPEILPVKFSTKNTVYRYDSRTHFKGESFDSGYIYLLRNENDTYMQFATFDAVKPIDLKFEVSNDFLQAPLTIMLTSANDIPFEDRAPVAKLVKNAYSQISAKGFVIAYGDIFESRTSLLVRNIPIGKYAIYVYFPGLKTKFTHERVCAIYDIIVEAKKSRNHFKAKEIIYTSETRDNNLDIPVRVPFSLNTPRFMSGFGRYTYINYENLYYLRYNKTEETSEEFKMFNSIPFTVASESYVNFEVSHNDINANKKVSVGIHNVTNYESKITKVLKPGRYILMIMLSEPKSSASVTFTTAEDFSKKAINKMIKLYIGISPLHRINDIYSYNNMLSSYRQCINSNLPAFDFIGENGEYRYSNAFFTLRREDIKLPGVIQSSEITLNKSNRNRFIASLGTDFVLNAISLQLVAGTKRFLMIRKNNYGFIDLTLPKGKYTIELRLDSPIEIYDHNCLMMSIDIHIIEIDNALNSDIMSKLTLNDYETKKDNILKPKCNGGIIPLEILQDTPITSQKIDEKGNYLLHLPNAVYFPLSQKSKTRKNINEIDISVPVDSLLHITTKVDSPKLFNVIPKIQYYYGKDENKNYYKKPKTVIVSPNMRERNTFYHLQKNSGQNNEFYILQLGLEKDIEYDELPKCPVYDLDLFIMDVTTLANKFNCVLKKGKVFQVKKPKMKIMNLTTVPYHEKIHSSYFTEKEYSEYIVKNEYYSGLSYSINFEVTKAENTQYYVNAEIGYHHSVSLFDLFLLQSDGELVSYSSTLYDKNTTFPYKRVLQATIKEGNYTLMIMEYAWHNMTNIIKAKSKEDIKNIYLCLPFSYSLDIVAINDASSLPEVVSIFPPGPIVFKAKDQDMNIKVTLNKSPFTKRQEPITMIYNFMNIVNAFYLTKKGKADTSEENSRIYPDKVQGSINSKEWDLLFMSDKFDNEYEYEFAMDERWIFDNNRAKFTMSKAKKPLIRIESSKKVVYEDEKENIQTTMTSAIDLNEERPVDKPTDSEQGGRSEQDVKCNGHGKYLYDNIMGKYLCTCFDGFSGKYCDYCEGKIENGKCMEVDEESFGSTEDIPTATMSDYSRPTSELGKKKTNNQSLHPRKDVKEAKDCGVCVNGICDVETGRCICDKNYKGVHCDERKLSFGHSARNIHNEKKASSLNSGWSLEWLTDNYYLNMIIKTVFVVVIIILVIYIIRVYIHRGKLTEYDIIGQGESDGIQDNSIGPINLSVPKLELDPENEEGGLVDYEISTVPKSNKEKK